MTIAAMLAIMCRRHDREPRALALCLRRSRSLNLFASWIEGMTLRFDHDFHKPDSPWSDRLGAVVDHHARLVSTIAHCRINRALTLNWRQPAHEPKMQLSPEGW
jgi:hypothetical protein